MDSHEHDRIRVYQRWAKQGDVQIMTRPREMYWCLQRRKEWILATRCVRTFLGRSSQAHTRSRKLWDRKPSDTKRQATHDDDTHVNDRVTSQQLENFESQRGLTNPTPRRECQGSSCTVLHTVLHLFRKCTSSTRPGCDATSFSHLFQYFFIDQLYTCSPHPTSDPQTSQILELWRTLARPRQVMPAHLIAHVKKPETTEYHQMPPKTTKNNLEQSRTISNIFWTSGTALSNSLKRSKNLQQPNSDQEQRQKL